MAPTPNLRAWPKLLRSGSSCAKCQALFLEVRAVKKTPLQTMKDKFQSKEKLVDALLGLLERRGGLSKDDLRKKLLVQSNSKLLVLHRREEIIRERFGSRANMIDSLLAAGKKKSGKEDKDWRRRLESSSAGQLLDLARRFKLARS